MYKIAKLIYTYGSTGIFVILQDAENMPSLSGAFNILCLHAFVFIMLHTPYSRVRACDAGGSVSLCLKKNKTKKNTR